jgi:hypothetical protein
MRIDRRTAVVTRSMTEPEEIAGPVQKEDSIGISKDWRRILLDEIRPEGLDRVWRRQFLPAVDCDGIFLGPMSVIVNQESSAKGSRY